MLKPLGRKQSVQNADWKEVFANIEQIVSKADVDALAEQTICDIRSNTDGKKAAYAWSAGKDSIVLGHLCESAGIRDSLIGVCRVPRFPCVDRGAQALCVRGDQYRA